MDSQDPSSGEIRWEGLPHQDYSTNETAETGPFWKRGGVEGGKERRKRVAPDEIVSGYGNQRLLVERISCLLDF